MNLSKGLQSTGWGARMGHKFEQITITSTIREIGHNTFAGGDNLSKVTLAGGAELLGRYAFNGCPQPQNVSAPSKVIVVEDR